MGIIINRGVSCDLVAMVISTGHLFLRRRDHVSVFDEWVLSIGITFQTVKTAAGLMIAKWRIFRGVHEYLLDIDCG